MSYHVDVFISLYYYYYNLLLLIIDISFKLFCHMWL